jgi:hypothetical protein
MMLLPVSQPPSVRAAHVHTVPARPAQPVTIFNGVRRMGFALAKPQDDYLHALGVMVSPSVSAGSATAKQASKASS